MKRVIGAFVVFLCLGLVASVSAQLAAPAAPAAPTLSETEQLLVQLVQVTDRLASCQQQLGTKQVGDLSRDVLRRVEAAHPGLTVDWATGKLVAKTPVK